MTYVVYVACVVYVAAVLAFNLFILVITNVNKLSPVVSHKALDLGWEGGEGGREGGEGSLLSRPPQDQMI